MRSFVRKLGRFYIVLIITVLSVILSSLMTAAFYFWVLGIPPLPVDIYISMIIPVVLTPICSWFLVGLLIKVDDLEQEMRVLATFDSLTGLLSRRAFLKNAEAFIDFAKREKISFSVIAVDLDNFKSINDNYGHSGGDEVLKNFAITATENMRKGDLIGRIGGEEFVILLPNTVEDSANILAERLHDEVRESKISYDKFVINYTVSMGLVSCLRGDEKYHIEEIIKQADDALYLAKNAGKNRTVFVNNTGA